MKRKIGRPRLPRRRRKTATFLVRADPESLTAWKRVAKMHHAPFGFFVRAALNDFCGWPTVRRPSAASLKHLDAGKNRP